MSFICSDCVGEPVLKFFVESKATNENSCDYCDSELPTVDLWDVTDKCDHVLTTFFEDSSQTMAVVHFGRTPAGKDAFATIEELAVVSEDVASDIVEALQTMWYDCDSGESRFVDDDPWFVLRSEIDSPLHAEWTNIESSLRSEARYVNPRVTEFMASIFGGISNDRTVEGESVLVDAGPKTTYEAFYRAREFQSERDIQSALEHPERLLGAPPSGIGPGGRMNAAGVPAFYGATNPDAALAEVRPAVGSSVVVAKFSVARPLKLLDLKRMGRVQLERSASLFDESTQALAQRHDFLRRLSERMVLPVVPKDQEKNYLVTQVVADYLAMHPNASIDGIIYPSVQSGQDNVSEEHENVVLFHKAATAIGADNDVSTAEAELFEYDEDGPGEFFRPKIFFRPVKPQYPFQLPGFRPKPALQLVADSIVIHRVLSVRIRTEPTEVEVVRDRER